MPSNKKPKLQAPTEIDVNGFKFEVVSAAEAATSDYIICVAETTPLLLEDNLTGACCKCGIGLQYRPNVLKKVKKICMDCVQIELVKDQFDKRKSSTKKAQ